MDVCCFAVGLGLVVAWLWVCLFAGLVSVIVGLGCLGWWLRLLISVVNSVGLSHLVWLFGWLLWVVNVVGWLIVAVLLGMLVIVLFDRCAGGCLVICF